MYECVSLLFNILEKIVQYLNVIVKCHIKILENVMKACAFSHVSFTLHNFHWQLRAWKLSDPMPRWWKKASRPIDWSASTSCLPDGFQLCPIICQALPRLTRWFHIGLVDGPAGSTMAVRYAILIRLTSDSFSLIFSLSLSSFIFLSLLSPSSLRPVSLYIVYACTYTVWLKRQWKEVDGPSVVTGAANHS